MLDVLAEADAARVGATGTPNFAASRRIEIDLVDAAHAARVELADVDRLGLEELLEDDAVLECSPVATRIGAISRADARVAEHVVGARRLLDPPRG